jgi:hypothetical protein
MVPEESVIEARTSLIECLFGRPESAIGLALHAAPRVGVGELSDTVDEFAVDGRESAAEVLVFFEGQAWLGHGFFFLPFGMALACVVTVRPGRALRPGVGSDGGDGDSRRNDPKETA